MTLVSFFFPQVISQDALLVKVARSAHVSREVAIWLLPQLHHLLQEQEHQRLHFWSEGRWPRAGQGQCSWCIDQGVCLKMSYSGLILFHASLFLLVEFSAVLI
jgi:hypothetical protein